VNGRKIRVIRKGKFQTVKWKDIKCGDIVEVLNDTHFPCDLVLLYAKTETGTCHIKTANLDGETNLKVRCVPNKFPHLNDENDLINLRGVITCEKPNTRLYEFKGRMNANNHQ
jgi:P-type E1-E2 ATPase